MRRRTARKKRSSRSLAMTSLGPPNRRGGGWVIVVLGGLVLVNLYVFVWNKDTSVGAIADAAREKPPAAVLPSQPLVTPPPQVVASATAAPVGPPGVVEGKVAKADTLGRILKRSGLSGAEADEVIRALAPVLDFKSIRAGQPYRIERGPDGRVRGFELVTSKIQTVRAERAATGELLGKADSLATKLEVKAIGGKIESSLYASVLGAGEKPALVDFFVDVFAYDLDFYNDTHDGDSFRVVVEKELADAELLRYRRILAAEYRGKAGTFRTFYFSPDGKSGGYFDVEGNASEKTLLKTPLKFHRISSGFDRKRMHPVLHTVRAHLGIDYAAPTGTPVWAAAPGTITYRAFHPGGAGNLVTIKHDGGIETHYMHLSKFADVKVGQRVPAKTVIGYVGSTGLSTGPHLHFGVKQKGAWIDPAKLVPIRSAGVSARDRAAFQAEVARLEKLLSAIKIASRE
jgi:murein DD-endopeptidase MepM/ murein hydrolase activator NlpD